MSENVDFYTFIKEYLKELHQDDLVEAIKDRPFLIKYVEDNNYRTLIKILVGI